MAADHVLILPVQRHQIEPALRLMLADENGLAGDEAVLDFLGFAVQRDIDVNQMWVAVEDDERGRIDWAILPIVSPGRTMLLFTPTRLPPDSGGIDVQHVARRLTNEVCEHWRARGVHLAQLLFDPRHDHIRDLYGACGFEALAELIYLHRTVRHAPDVAPLPDGYTLQNYTAASHAAFAQAIVDSYEGSLDCPALNGRRDVQDVIAGHKATGAFDPSLWYLLSEDEQPRGVLVLSPTHTGNSLELVYLGLTPAARGRQLGDALMRRALADVVRAGRAELTLAVDAVNAPALRLYYRHGLKRIGSRIALMRDLRPAPQTDQVGMLRP
jgi:ribosomal protein S18 acetylase RimI-like enzyme